MFINKEHGSLLRKPANYITPYRTQIAESAANLCTLSLLDVGFCLVSIQFPARAKNKIHFTVVVTVFRLITGGRPIEGAP